MNLPRLTPAEFEIMDVIWNGGEMTVTEVMNHVNAAGRKTLSRSTIQVQMQRLAEKGWLKHRDQGKTFFYSATVKRSDATARIAEDVKKRVSLIKPNEVVIDEEELTMVITYPLSVDVRVELKKEGGFTRMFIFKSIYEAYKQIYEEEDEKSGDPGTYNNLYNRKRSTGKYGIWGHYLEDLVIESVSYNPKKKELYMFIGS